MKPITRRRWLMEAAALATLPGVLWAGGGDEEIVDFADSAGFTADLQAANPRVKCYDLRRLAQPLTPITEFFAFHQTTVPPIDPNIWRLEIGRLVDRPQSFSLADLATMPVQELEFTLECAGNMPRGETMNGQISNARWAGVSLSAVLNRCGIQPAAREVVFLGADHIRDATGAVSRLHGRSVFVQDAVDPEAILALRMNGETLPPEHGFPLRLILPGWYGMAQIKWLTRIEVIDRRYEGLHMSRNYQTVHALPTAGGEPILFETSISRTRLKSVVARVTRRRRGQAWSYRVSGAAWGGPAPIERVELRIDQGPWQATRIDHRGGRHAWLLWSHDWNGATPGRHTLTSRAIDAEGRIQPTVGERRNAIRSVREDNAQWERVIELPA